MEHKDLNTKETANSDLGAFSGSFLSEAILIIENLMAYSRIHTVKEVRYVEGSHEEILDKAKEWLKKVRKNYRQN